MFILDVPPESLGEAPVLMVDPKVAYKPHPPLSNSITLEFEGFEKEGLRHA